jgi:hypothetical protein
LKSTIAGFLIEEFTQTADTVLDPFCGSGTIPLECVLRGRSIVAFDINKYAITLTRAKLEAPNTLNEAVERASVRLASAERRPQPILDDVPGWVREFFHPETLRSAIQLAEECIEKDDAFVLACLLGILHHQRPGFLSFPSSHLVPYLRERKFPRDKYPEMYEERAIEPRLRAKVQRAFRLPRGRLDATGTVALRDVRSLIERPYGKIDAIITSPPYMNALDYMRDNRLRMWFLDHSTPEYSPEKTDKPAEFISIVDALVAGPFRHLVPGGRCVLVVGETVNRKRMTSHPAETLLARVRDTAPYMSLDHVIEDTIPDVRRTRRDGAATKKELVLVFRKGSHCQQPLGEERPAPLLPNPGVQGVV